MDPVLVPTIRADEVRTEAPSAPRRKATWRSRLGRLAIVAVPFVILAAVLLLEMRTSNLQALVLSRFAREIGWAVESHAGTALRAPDAGPYDTRLGYNRLPGFLERLESAGFTISAQAHPSPRMGYLVTRGVFPIYREKTQAGLSITDRQGASLYESRTPERVFASFDAIPPLIISTLLFVENRELLDPQRPRLNPAVEWYRLSKAVGFDILGKFGRQGQPIGASTLATQIEKFRHSREGRTRSPGEKFKQMVSASLRAYQGGTLTLPARRQIVVDYLNSTPLAAAPGYGEVLGLGDGLRAWYGVPLEDTDRILSGDRAPDAARGQAYRQGLSLLLAP